MFHRVSLPPKPSLQAVFDAIATFLLTEGRSEKWYVYIPQAGLVGERLKLVDNLIKLDKDLLQKNLAPKLEAFAKGLQLKWTIKVIKEKELES